MSELPDALIAVVREAIYASFVESGAAPAVRDVAISCGFAERDVADAYRALADGHVIVLQPGTLDVRWAPPFSMVPTSFRSIVGGRRWYAPCAWDAFGIPAALHRDAEIDARCGWSDEPIPCGVRDGAAYGRGVIHLLVPAVHFWDDIGYT
jgi:hypothetical protein